MPLSKRALDALGRISELEEIREFTGAGGVLAEEIYRFVVDLEGPLRCQLALDDWTQKVEREGDFIWLNLHPKAWHLPDDEFVAFGFGWCNPFQEEADNPYVFVRIPPSDIFPYREKLLKQIRDSLIKIGFEDQSPGEDVNPYYPVWKYLPLDSFQSPSGFDSGALEKAAIDIFRALLPHAALVDQVFKSLTSKPPVPPPIERHLKTVAFVDTETAGTGPAAKMTELAIIDVAFDEAGDQIAGVLDEYSMKGSKKLNESKARSLLERAEVIVAHNAEFDRGVLGRALPGSETRKWVDSCHGINWKNLTGAKSESLEALLGAEGLRQGQDHHALEDARDLLRLLSVQRDGVTYLTRLLRKS